MEKRLERERKKLLAMYEDDPTGDYKEVQKAKEAVEAW